MCRAKRFRHAEKGSSSRIRRHPSLAPQATLRRRTQAPCRRQLSVTPPQLRVADNPLLPRPSFVWQTTLRHPTPARRRGRPSVAHDSCPPSISQPKTANPAVVRRDLPRVETKYLEFPPRCACASRAVGFQRVSDPLAGVQGAAPPAAVVRRDLPLAETQAHHLPLRSACNALPQRDSKGSQTLWRGCRGQRPLRVPLGAVTWRTCRFVRAPCRRR